MSDLKLEETVILWDCSRSMIRLYDLGKNKDTSRYRIAQKIIRIFIDSKMAIDFKDFISVVTYGARTKKLCDFINDSEEIQKKIVRKIDISGNSNLADGIAFALQILVKQIQKLGGKLQRIFIVTDNSKLKSTERLEKLSKMAQGLGVYIDICQIGEPKDKKNNPLKNLAYSTNAEYAFFTNLKALFRAAEGFASKKITKESDDYFNPDKDENKLPPLITEIAVDLRRPSIGEIREMMHGQKDYKCQVCYQNKCETCQTQFYGCGRFCPSCGRPIHLHCASLWAERSEFSQKNVFRCPFCYFLLHVPKSVQKLLKVTGGQAIKIIDEDNLDGQPIKMIRIPDNEIDDIDDACTYCNNIFTGERKVFQCSGCKSYYHEDCLKNVYDDIKACRTCGGAIT